MPRSAVTTSPVQGAREGGKPASAAKAANGVRPAPTARGQSTRRKIIAAAERAFGELGYEHCRVADIVGHAGISHGAFYRHFADKDQALVAVLEQLNTEIRAVMNAERRTPGMLDEDTLIRRNTRFFETYARHRLLLRVSREAAARPDAGSFLALWRGQRSIYINRSALWLSRLAEQGALDPALDPACVAEALGSMTEQLAYVHVGLADHEPSPERIAELGRIAGQIWWRMLRGPAP